MLQGQLSKVINHVFNLFNSKIKLETIENQMETNVFLAKSYLVKLMFTLFRPNSEFEITAAELDNVEADDRYRFLLPSTDCHYRNLIKIFDKDGNERIAHREWLSFYG